MGVSEKRKAYLKHQNKRSKREEDEIKALESAILEGAPAKGTNPLSLQGEGPAPANATYATARTFEDLPLSQYTKDALRSSGYITLTAIQRAALPHGLAGRDVLGAAKTGSGKTLTFLIPVVEKLFRSKWSKTDGLGALVMTPTRELAMQIFEELKKVGKNHDLSAALLIGGKKVKGEQETVGQMNVLVCTPGRLLQHMDETPGFDCTNTQILVLDEADRILDMGFAVTLDAIIANLPTERQTMLFSATQTKSIKDLARLSLVDPEYLAVHSEASAPTPLKLQQAFAVVGLHEKLDVLWGFIKAHMKAKTIVFLSTCKQVRFVHEAFKKLRPGIPVRALHGGMKQMKRLGVFYEFSEESASVLFATDIAARGLDFPTVDWVFQFDCPEDVHAYIHRVGRTARYMSAGRSLMLLLPSEKEGMMEDLNNAKIPLKQIKLNPNKALPVAPALQALLSKNVDLKEYAQRSLVAYVRSVFLQPNKKVFDVTKLPVAECAQSMGLLAAPKLRFLKKVGKKTLAVEVGGQSDAVRALHDAADAAGNGGDADSNAAQRTSSISKADGSSRVREGGGKGSEGGAAAASGQLPSRKKQSGKGEAAEAGPGSRKDEDSEDDFLVIKQRHTTGDSDDDDDDEAGGAVGPPDAAALEAAGKLPKKKKKPKIRVGKSSGSRVVFDEEGQAVAPFQLLADSEFGRDDEMNEGNEDANADGVYVVKKNPEERFKAVADIMRKRDRDDKERLKQLRYEMKAEMKARQRGQDGEDAGGVVAMLGGAGGSGDDQSGDEDEGVSDAEEEGQDASADSNDDNDNDEDDGDGDESDEEEVEATPKRRKGASGAAEKLSVKSASKAASLAAERPPRGSMTEPKPARASKAEAMSLADQESLALKLLSQRR